MTKYIDTTWDYMNFNTLCFAIWLEGSFSQRFPNVTNVTFYREIWWDGGMYAAIWLEDIVE